MGGGKKKNGESIYKNIIKEKIMYKKDSNIFSLIWGRMGASILLGIATLLSGYGFVFELEEQQMIFDVIASIFAGIAFIQVTISKIRETKKIEK